MTSDLKGLPVLLAVISSPGVNREMEIRWATELVPDGSHVVQRASVWHETVHQAMRPQRLWSQRIRFLHLASNPRYHLSIVLLNPRAEGLTVCSAAGREVTLSLSGLCPYHSIAALQLLSRKTRHMSFPSSPLGLIYRSWTERCSWRVSVCFVIRYEAVVGACSCC